MRLPEFRFQRRWTVPAPVAAVQAVLADLEHYPEWWPQVRAVARIDDDTARVRCRSALPYTLDLVLQAVRREPGLLEVAIGGDLDGTARFELTAHASGTQVHYEQRVSVADDRLGALARLAPAAAAWNHERMMAGCETGLARWPVRSRRPPG